MSPSNITQFDKESPGRRFSVIHRLSQVYLSGQLAEAGINKGKIPYLMKILNSPGIVQEDLTKHLCLDRAATARALQALEANGFVERREDPLDRRKKNVYPTPKAKQLQGEMVAALQAHNDVIFSGFSEDEQNLLMALLDRVIGNLQENLEVPSPDAMK